jgi:hypothetical protein
MPHGGARFDMPMIEEPPSTDTRFDLPALGGPSGLSGLSGPQSVPRRDTRFDLPVVDDFDMPRADGNPRVDHVWPAREDLPSVDPLLNRTSLDLGGAQLGLSQTRFDMPAVDDYQYGDRFTQTSADGMRALAPDVAFHPAPPAGSAGLVAPADEQPMSWADETSFDRFDDSGATATALAPAPSFSPDSFGPDSGEFAFAPDTGGFAVAPAAFTPAPEAAPLRTTGPRRAASGKRRGHSRDKREWMALGAIAVVAAGAIGGVLMKFVFSGPSGPQHTVSTPDKVGSFTREPGLEKQMKIDQLRASVIKSSDGKASGVSSGVFQQGASGIGNNPQIYMFVGGKLANSDPQASLTNFEQAYKQGGAHAVTPGSLGGQAACATSTVNGESVSMCVWFDNDTFGEFVSPTMTPAKLAATMAQARPNLEHLAH